MLDFCNIHRSRRSMSNIINRTDQTDSPLLSVGEFQTGTGRARQTPGKISIYWSWSWRKEKKRSLFFYLLNSHYMLNDRVTLYWVIIVYINVYVSVYTSVCVCLWSELELDINRLHVDTFTMDRTKEKRKRKEKEKDARIIVQLLLFHIEVFLCDAESIKFSNDWCYRYEK